MTGTKLAPPESMADQVFAIIRRAIMSGDLPAGHRLRIRDVAAQVGTSVMPVREAIRRLEEAGLAERVPHKGAVVRSLGLVELIHIYDARRVLETEAARRGARAITRADVQDMEGGYHRLQALVAKGDLVGALDADEDLLLVLYRAGENPVLVELIQGLWQRCRPYKIAGVQQVESDENSAWALYQPRLIEAARTNDAPLAGRVTDQSLRHAARRIEAHLAHSAREGEAREGVARRAVVGHRAPNAGGPHAGRRRSATA